MHPDAGFHTCFVRHDKKSASVMHKEGRALKTGGAFHCRMPVSPFVSLSGRSACRHNGGDKAKRAQALHSHVRNHVACRCLRTCPLSVLVSTSAAATPQRLPVDLEKRYDLAPGNLCNINLPALLGFTAFYWVNTRLRLWPPKKKSKPPLPKTAAARPCVCVLCLWQRF